jgi:hypothetical protein
MKKLHLSILSISTTFLLSSCYYDNFKELHPAAALPSAAKCDTSGVISYSTQIVPILTTNCTQSCHFSGAAGGGPSDLTDYNVVSADAADLLSPGDGGSLYSSVVQDGLYANPMPKNGSKMSDCDIAKIKKWAVAGAPNN